MISALDHIQLAMPAGGEREARGFYSGLLGLNELEKPARPAAARGSRCRMGGSCTSGVEEPFRASRKAHPAFVAADLEELAGEMGAAGSPVRWDDGLAPRRRFYGEDPLGNRLEFLEPRH